MIVVDAFNLALVRGTGVATYTRNLVRNIAAMGHDTGLLYGLPAGSKPGSLVHEVEFFDALEPRHPEHPAMTFLRGLNPMARRAYAVQPTGAVLYRQLERHFPPVDSMMNAPGVFNHATVHFMSYGTSLRVTLPKHADIVHWTYPLPLRVPGVRNIYTMHDLVPLRLPYTTGDKKRHYFKLSRHLAETCDHIVTVSETSRKDIIDLLGVPPHKVTNTYQSVHIPEPLLAKPPTAVEAELRGILGLEYKGYFLFYGAIEPKKNVKRIVEAYLAADLEQPLVIIGSHSFKAGDELQLLLNEEQRLRPEGLGLGRRQRIIPLEYVSFPQLVSLLRGALAVTFPSLYEGFGLPVIEAMLCDTPVITSNQHSTREIAGDGALLVDPYSVGDISQAMRAIAANAELRSDLVAKGRKIAQGFSEEAYRKRLGELYVSLGTRPDRQV